jgi:5'(3')-deoxyribonucleotidase
MAAKPILAVDVDEVLAQFVAGLAAFHNETYGTSLSVADFSSYRFKDVWGGTDAEATEKVHKFFESEHFLNLAPVPGSLEAVKVRFWNAFDGWGEGG